jgi:hypothetical protein
MAKLLGEEHFSCLFHQGERDNIQLSLVGDRTLLTILFDDRTTVGMVRLYANETCKKLCQVFENAAIRQASGKGEGMEVLDDGYGKNAKSALDKFFN